MTDQSRQHRSAAIRRRAQELAARGEAEDLVAAAEVLAGVQDGGLAFDDLDDEAVERLVQTLGMETVVGTIAAIERGTDAGRPLGLSEESNVPATTIAPPKRSQGRYALLRRAPVWLAMAATIAIVTAIGMYVKSDQPQSGPAIATAPSAPPGVVDERPSSGSTSGGPLAFVWTPHLLNQTPSVLGRASLEQLLPDYERDPAGGATLGGNRANRYLPMQQATVIVRSENGWGSGAFISGDGWLLTNYHVVEDVAQKASTSAAPVTLDIITPMMVDGKLKPAAAVKARVYRVDPVHDLALLKLEQTPASEIPHFSLASTVEDGDECIVIGSQGNGPAWWVRRGVVSQQFDFPNDLSQFAAGVRSDRTSINRTRVRVVVTDTRVSGGDSGGPLLNDQGQLIGLTFATAANETSGSIGWHIALSHLQSFVAKMPTAPEGVPFDTWTAGLGQGVGFQSEFVDGDRDGRIDGVGYVYAEAGEDGRPRPVARTLFIDFSQRATRSEAAQDRVPAGLWGMDRGKFRFDAFLSTRADGTVALGYTDGSGNVDQIRIGRVRSDAATVIWRRDASGRWQGSRPSTATSLVDSTRLTPTNLARLRALTGDQSAGGDNGPAPTERDGAPGRGRGANKQ
jgi:S1-C subfamily serine protease